MYVLFTLSYYSVLLFIIKPIIGPSLGPTACLHILASCSRLVSTLVPIIFILALLLLSALLVLVLDLVLISLLVVVSSLLGCRPPLIRSLVLLLGVKVVTGGDGVIQVVVIALIGTGMCLLLPSIQLQRAVPHSITNVDQQT